jgi:hypothetical protein
MLVKEISRTLLSKNATAVDKLIEAGYKLVVKKKGKVVFTINPPIPEEKKLVEEDLSYLLEDETLFTKINETNYDPYDYSSVPKSGQDDPVPAVRLGYRKY